MTAHRMTEKGLAALRNDTQMDVEMRLMLEVMALGGGVMTEENCIELIDGLLKACDGDFEKAVDFVKSGKIKLVEET